MTKSGVFYKIKPNLITKKIKKDFLVINAETENFYIFNETAELIFKLLTRKKSIQEITTKLCNKFEVSSQRVEKDIRRFISKYLNNLFESH